VDAPDPSPHAANTTPAPRFSAGGSGLLDKQRAARWASVSVRTLDRWIANGLPVYRSGPGAKPLVRPADIADLRLDSPVEAAPERGKIRLV